MNAWRADPLVWGHGPRIFEVFLEPTCPFSVRAFGKLEDLLDKAGEDRITVKVRLQSQPWHMYSGVIVRCILAASTFEGGKTAAKSVMAAVAAHREELYRLPVIPRCGRVTREAYHVWGMDDAGILLSQRIGGRQSCVAWRAARAGGSASGF